MGIFEDAVKNVDAAMAERKSKDTAKDTPIPQDMSAVREANAVVATMPAYSPGISDLPEAIAKQLYAGSVYQLPQMAQQSMQSAGRLAEEIGGPNAIADYLKTQGKLGAEAVQINEKLDNSTRPVFNPETDPIKSTFEQSVRSIPMSVVGLPIMVANPVAGAALTIGMFGGQGSQETYDKVYDYLTKQGMSPEEAHRKATIAGYWSGGAQGVGEIAGDWMMSGLLSGVGKISNAFRKVASTSAKKTGVEVLKEIANPKLLKEFAKASAESVVSEATTEGLQDVGTSAAERNAGLPHEDLGKIFTQSAAGGAAMTLMTLPLGAIGAHVQHKQLQMLRETLADPNNKASDRMTGAMAVYDELKHSYPEQAKNWIENAAFSVDRGQPITLDPSNLQPVKTRLDQEQGFVLQGTPYGDVQGPAAPTVPVNQALLPAPDSGNLPVVAPETRPAVPDAFQRVDASYGPEDPNYQIYGFPYEPASPAPTGQAALPGVTPQLQLPAQSETSQASVVPAGPITRATQNLRFETPSQPVLSPSDIARMPEQAPVSSSPVTPIAKAAQHAALVPAAQLRQAETVLSPGATPTSIPRAESKAAPSEKATPGPIRTAEPTANQIAREGVISHGNEEKGVQKGVGQKAGLLTPEQGSVSGPAPSEIINPKGEQNKENQNGKETAIAQPNEVGQAHQQSAEQQAVQPETGNAAGGPAPVHVDASWKPIDETGNGPVSGANAGNVTPAAQEKVNTTPRYYVEKSGSGKGHNVVDRTTGQPIAGFASKSKANIRAKELNAKESQTSPVIPEVRKPVVSPNTIFTEDAYAKAKKLLQSKLSQVSVGIDPEIMQAGFTMAGYHIEKGARTFAAFSKAMVADLGDAVKPYLKAFYNGVRDLPGIEHITKQMDAHELVSKTNIDEALKSEPAKTPEKMQATKSLAAWVKERLSKGEDFNKLALMEQANGFFGGKMSEGKYTAKDAFDAMEMGINQYVLDNPLKYNPIANAEKAKEIVDRIREKIIDKMASQNGIRTEEQDEFQQFSTIPDTAYVMAWVANLKNGKDVALEPSAGPGGLLVYAKIAGADTIGNEFSARRAEILKESGIADKVFTENAEQLNNILPDDVKPTVVLMNPPFSSTAGRMKGERSSKNVVVHMEQALKRLEPNGRLVALIGKGFFADPKVITAFFDKIKQEYNLRAIIGIDGKGYKKYGTDYDNRIIVIDKSAPDGVATVKADVSDVKDAIDLLKEVRDARAVIEPTSAEQSSGQVEQTDQTPGERGAEQPASHVVDAGAEQSNRPAESNGPGAPVVNGTQVAGNEGSKEGVSGVGKPGRKPRRPGSRGNGAVEGDLGNGQPGERSAVAPVESLVQPGQSESDRLAELTPLQIQSEQEKAADGQLTDSLYEDYRPQKLKMDGAQPHPGTLVQSAAMASVEPPNPTYGPHLPKELITSGKLSLAQIEAIVYAGQAHQDMLPGGVRKGFFIGDGTGVGKGREISAIIMDNIRQGRKKAIWLSTSSDLIGDARRDFEGIGGDGNKIFDLSKHALGKEIGSTDGILFTTYSTLKSGMEVDRGGNIRVKPAKTGEQQKMSRLEQVANWLGKDFDGVIAIDEAHKLSNNIAVEGGRGNVAPAAQALAGIELQRRLPNARVVYVSATGATRPDALGYLERLGIWGEGTPFASKRDFIISIKNGGLAAMEVVARDLKAMGLYISRSLDFSKVTYGTLEHPLTLEQKDAYNTFARAWQNVLRNIDAALALTGGDHSTAAKMAAYSKFWGSNQRFFNQVVTAMQMPSVIEDIKKQLAEDKSIVIQLVNTNEAVMNRALAGMEGEDSLDDLDMTPKENLMQYIQNGFPTQQYETYLDDNGNEQSRAVVDSEGNPVHNAEAVAAKERFLDELGSMKTVPDGPLEYLLNTFGADMVAEVTGRSHRVYRQRDAETGVYHKVEEKWSKAKGRSDVDAFMGGKKRILVFSDAGGTGRSFHSDKTAKNQQRRVHYLVQPGWRADNAVQGFGRTHRTNEANAPHYVLVTTDLKGQKRFISSIARRLDQLGALTKGERKAGSQGLFSMKDNLESSYASDALTRLFHDLAHGPVDGFTLQGLADQLGLRRVIDSNGQLNVGAIPGIPQFLNRILSLEHDQQNRVFDMFFERLEENIDRAIAQNTLDFGLENYKSDGMKVETERPVYTDTKSKAETRYVQLEAKHKNKFFDFESAASQRGFRGFFLNEQSGKIWAVKEHGSFTDERGNVIQEVLLRSPMAHNYRSMKDHEFQRGNWKELTHAEAEAAWNEQIAESPKDRSEKLHLIAGALLPIWDRLPQEQANQRVIRVQTDEGKRYIGRLIDGNRINEVLRNLGAGETKVDISSVDAVDKIANEGYVVELANGWKFKRSFVGGESRVELVADNLYKFDAELQHSGMLKERINFNTRYFVPSGEKAVEVYDRLTAHRPVSNVVSPAQGTTKFYLDRSAIMVKGESNNENRQSRNALQSRGVAGNVRSEEARRLAEIENDLNFSRPDDRKVELLPSVPPDGVDAQTLAQLAGVFGKKILYAKIYGIGLGAFAYGKDTIVINTVSKDPHLSLFWHELVESLSTDSPALYAKFHSFAQDYMFNTSEFKANLNEEERFNLLPESSKFDAERELLANLAGKHGKDASFISELHRMEPTLFDKIIDAMKSLIKRIERAFIGREADLHFTDPQKVIDALTDTLALYAREKANAPVKDAVLDEKTGEFKRQKIKYSLQSLSDMKGNNAEAMPHLVNIGQSVIEDGASTYQAFAQGMKKVLGDLWDTFKHLTMKVYAAAKAANASLGNRGSFKWGNKETSAPGEVPGMPSSPAQMQRIDGEIIKNAKEFQKSVQGTTKAFFDLVSSAVPPTVKHEIGKLLSTPWHGSEDNVHRRGIVKVATKKMGTFSQIVSKIYSNNFETAYLGLEGMKNYLYGATYKTTNGKEIVIPNMGTAERARVDQLIKQGNILKKEWSDRELRSENNPTGAAVSENVRMAYKAARQVAKMIQDEKFAWLDRLAIMPYADKSWFGDLERAYDANPEERKSILDGNKNRTDIEKALENTKSYRSEIERVKMTQHEWAGYAPQTRKEGYFKVSAYRKFSDWQVDSEPIVTGGQEKGKRMLIDFNLSAEQIRKVKEIMKELGISTEIDPNGAIYATMYDTKKNDGKYYTVEDDLLSRLRETMPVSADAPLLRKVYMQTRKTQMGANRHVAEVQGNLEKHLKGNYDKAAQYDIKSEPNTSTPEELMNFKGTDLAMQSLINRAMEEVGDRGFLPEDSLDAIKQAVTEAHVRELMARGFGRSHLKRAAHHIEGYQDTDYLNVFSKHAAHMAGWVSKMQFAIEGSNVMRDIPKENRIDKVWVHDYAKFLMKNSSTADEMAATARSAASIMYMGLKFSAVVVNGFQNFTMGQAELSRWTDNAMTKLVTAQKQVFDDYWTFKRTGRHTLSDLEVEVLNRAYREGIDQAQVLEQMSGIGEQGASKNVRKAATKALSMFQWVETHVNREPMMLAAYRAFTEKNIKAGTAVEGKFDQNAYDRAEEVVYNAHILGGKANMPALARSPIGMTLYVFQGYTHNFLHWIYNRAKNGEFSVIARSMAAIVALGGVAALPIAGDVDKWIKKWFGVSYGLKFQKYVKDYTQGMGKTGDVLNDFVNHGAPSILGLDMSRAIGVNVPFVSDPDKTMAERVGGAWGGLLQKPSQAMQALGSGDTYRAVESIMPEFVAQPMRGYRQQLSGATSMSGRPIADAQGRQITYSAADVAKKAFGFNPLEASKQQEVNRSGIEIKTTWEDRRNNALSQLRKADDPEAIRAARQNIMQFNSKLRESQAFGLVNIITADSIRRSTAARKDNKSGVWAQNYLD